MIKAHILTGFSSNVFRLFQARIYYTFVQHIFTKKTKFKQTIKIKTVHRKMREVLKSKAEN